MLAELPREQAVALALTLDDVGERHWFLGGKRLAERLDEDLDLTATCQTDVEGHLIADAVRHQPRVILLEHLFGMFDDVVLDAPTRNGPDELAIFGNGHLRPRPPRGRTIRLHHGRHRDLLAGLAPAFDVWEELFHE